MCHNRLNGILDVDYATEFSSAQANERAVEIYKNIRMALKWPDIITELRKNDIKNDQHA